MGGVTFVTVHIVGSNDNFGRTPEMDAEHLERKAANIAWMKQAFAEAKASQQPRCRDPDAGQSGLREFLAANRQDPLLHSVHSSRTALPTRRRRLRRLCSGACRRVGDLRQAGRLPPWRHSSVPDRQAALQQEDQPSVRELHARGDLRWPDSHWVRITVDPADPQLFRFKAEIVPENVVNRRAN